MLQVRVFAVTDKTAVGQRWIWRFEVQLVVRINLFLHVEVETVGVITLVSHPGDHAKLAGIQAAEAIAQVLTWRAVQAEAVAGFFLPAFGGVFQALNDGDGFGTQLLVVVHVFL
ncbi:hypothetical protein D3C79_535150 [compost metagenome]